MISGGRYGGGLSSLCGMRDIRWWILWRFEFSVWYRGYQVVDIVEV